MTDRERVIITAYTGFTMVQGDKLGLFYKYLEEILGFPIMTHELASKELWELIHEKSKDDFISLCRD